MRTIFVWAPLVLGLHGAAIAFAIYVLFYYPLTRFGWVAYGKGAGTTLLFIGCMVGVIALVFFIIGKIYTIFFKNKGRVSLSSEEQKERPSGLLRVIWMYVRATKQKMCPIINFTNASEKEVT